MCCSGFPQSGLLPAEEERWELKEEAQNNQVNNQTRYSAEEHLILTNKKCGKHNSIAHLNLFEQELINMYAQVQIAKNRHTHIPFWGMLCLGNGTGGWSLSRCLIIGGFTWRSGQIWHGHGLSSTFHSDLISNISFVPARWICTDYTGIDLWKDSQAQSGKCSKAKIPTQTKPGWHAGQWAYRMKHRREGNMKKMHFARRNHGLCKHIDRFHRSARWN